MSMGTSLGQLANQAHRRGIGGTQSKDLLVVLLYNPMLHLIPISSICRYQFLLGLPILYLVFH